MRFTPERNPVAGTPSLTASISVPPAAPYDPYLYRIRDLVCRVSGIFHSDHKLYFVADRCARRMRSTGATCMQEYYGQLADRGGRPSELVALLNEITVGETCFFRNLPQLDAIRKIVIPAIVQERARLAFTHLRIWSAGCSTGEEPYTLAMVLEEELQRALRGWTFELLATDLNEKSLDFAKKATYGDYALRNTPLYYLQKYFRRRHGLHHVSEQIRKRVSFTSLNLVDDSKMLFMKGMDIVFCSNVLIYFEGQARRRVVQHFFNNLIPGGYFFLGHSESLFGVNGDFKLMNFTGGSLYTRPFRQISAAGAR